MATVILLVEDDAFLREGLTTLFENEGYRVCAVRTAGEARGVICDGAFDLAVLDVRLPDGSGLDLCREIKNKSSASPVLMLTACDDENEIVAGFDAGADDYVTKPFGIRVLLSRIRALLRRASPAMYEHNGLYVDFLKMTVRKNGEQIYLTPIEFQLLTKLIKNAGIVVTRNSLLAAIWDNDGSFIDDNTLSVHISRLREKIASPELVTVRGVGYRWEEKQ